MNSQDRADFDKLMKKLCIGLGALPSPDRLTTYFEGLAKMSVIQFSRVVDSCLDETDGVGKLPAIPAIWKIWHGIRDKARTRTQQIEAPLPKLSKEQMVIDSMFLRYLERRRLKERFQGDINLAQRRQACLAIVKDITAAQITDWQTDMEAVAIMFNAEMAKIPDRAPSAL